MAARQHAAPARLLFLMALLGMLAAVALFVWVGPGVAAWVSGGRLVRLGFWKAQGAALRGVLGSDTSGYPVGIRRALASGGEFWLVQALLVIMGLSLAGAILRAVDVRASRPASDRRWWQL